MLRCGYQTARIVPVIIASTTHGLQYKSLEQSWGFSTWSRDVGRRRSETPVTLESKRTWP